MQQEFINGNDGLFGSNDGDASRDFASSAKCSQKDLNDFFEILNEFRQSHLDIHHSNRRLDSFLFYYSSKL